MDKVLTLILQVGLSSRTLHLGDVGIIHPEAQAKQLEVILFIPRNPLQWQVLLANSPPAQSARCLTNSTAITVQRPHHFSYRLLPRLCQ